MYVAVRGRVQGVGFRWFVRERARALGLAGWVRNTPDGAVEVLAVGNDDALQKLRNQLLSGPSGARVSAVEDQKALPSVEALDPFGILK